jgi:hypothetical protein
MSLLFTILLAAVAAAYFASIPCRAAESRNRRPAWHFVLLGVLAAAVLPVLFIFQDDLFRPSAWHKGKVEMTFLVPMWFAIGGGIGLIPSFFVVWTYRQKYEDAHGKA